MIVIVAGILGYRYFVSRRDGEFKTARVYRGTVREELILSGQIAAEEHANLSFLSSGELDYVGVIEGAEVKKGEVLVKLNSTNAYQTFLQAEADLRRYEASLSKTYDDIKGHEKDESFAQREDRTISETNRDKAYRAYVIARKNLSTTTLYAPFDGIIASISHPFSGINTSLTESQIEIVNPKTIYFDVSADQSEVNQISEGQNVLILLDSFSDKEYKGVVDFVGLTPKQGEVGAVYDVKVKIFSDTFDSSEVKIGMTGDAKFVLSQKEDELFVPPEFVNSDTTGKYLKVGKENNKTFIETGLEGEESVEIKSDKIKEGDVVYD